MCRKCFCDKCVRDLCFSFRKLSFLLSSRNQSIVLITMFEFMNRRQATDANLPEEELCHGSAAAGGCCWMKCGVLWRETRASARRWCSWCSIPSFLDRLWFVCWCGSRTGWCLRVSVLWLCLRRWQSWVRAKVGAWAWAVLWEMLPRSRKRVSSRSSRRESLSLWRLLGLWRREWARAGPEARGC